MFDALKIYKAQEIDLEDVYGTLVQFGYKRVGAITEEGDFSTKGENIFVFPTTFEYPVRIELCHNKVEGIKSIDLVSYKTISDHKMLIILPIKGLLRKRKYRPSKPPKEIDPIDAFVDIEPSDYVVHTDYGIGKYLGIERIQTKSGFVDHLVIEYKGKDTLYVPFDDLNKVQKYVSFERKPPKLYRMGSRMWSVAKKRAEKGATKMALDILEIQAKRSMMKGFKYSKDTDWQKVLEESFAFKETEGQARASTEVKQDMEATKPMDRLLCGDVGYGKTEVALRAVFKAVMDNKQAAVLVPTTILAEQHYTVFKERMKDFPVNIEMLSRFKTRPEQKNILDAVKSGRVDVIIGTHRLLSDDVRIKNLGLLVIDEEQRFGVKHKEKLKMLRLVIDVLTLTATPIPRTLYLALMGGRDISVIDTPPLERLPVKTYITEFDERMIRNAIRNEARRKGQVYFVHNRIIGIEKVRERLKKMLPDLRIAVAHGRMVEKELEKTMGEFIRGEIDVLLSTTIIESGIDIPNANTILINDADTFGLADLYQLRGRVGRFNRRAFCYLIVKRLHHLAGNVQKRLFTIKKYQELGSGFKIAMQDLEIRGAGNLLGTQQHGFIETVGFDLYCRLLRGAIEVFKKKR
ncbi:MAG: transcription-repair coupling factor [Candidatus Omnitrophica bacterium]|nr:transcription-repair coupling factor [Candidatus Omnitrophota bacterium]